MVERGTGLLPRGDLRIQRREPVPRQLAHPRPVIGGIGAVSVVKAVYIDRRELKCACVGGSSNVPLGFLSLTENLMMIGMALWMLIRHV